MLLLLLLFLGMQQTLCTSCLEFSSVLSWSTETLVYLQWFYYRWIRPAFPLVYPRLPLSIDRVSVCWPPCITRVSNSLSVLEQSQSWSIVSRICWVYRNDWWFRLVHYCLKGGRQAGVLTKYCLKGKRWSSIASPMIWWFLEYRVNSTSASAPTSHKIVEYQKLIAPWFRHMP